MGARIRSSALAALALAALAACAPGPSGPPTATVSALVNDEGYLIAEGHVDGVAEDGGLCTFTFWSEGGGASRLTSTGVADGSRTVCAPVDERIRTLWRGPYEAMLAYESASTSVESEPFAFVVPDTNP